MSAELAEERADTTERIRRPLRMPDVVRVDERAIGRMRLFAAAALAIGGFGFGIGSYIGRIESRLAVVEARLSWVASQVSAIAAKVGAPPVDH